MTEKNLTPEELQKKAIKRGMYLLQKQDRTEQQLRDKLKQDGYGEEHIEAAIEYVKSYHYLDDERYARNYIRYQSGNKSRQKLKTALMQKGISQELISLAMEEEYMGDEKEQIRYQLEKKGFLCGEISIEERQKMVASLFRKGFRINDIKDVMGSMDDNSMEEYD